MKRLYIAGPMSGLPDLNFPMFNAAAEEYREKGYVVINPAELNPGSITNCETHSEKERAKIWNECMRIDIAALMTCDEVLMLRGWEKSEGAILERHNALKLGMPVHYHATEHAGV